MPLSRSACLAFVVIAASACVSPAAGPEPAYPESFETRPYTGRGNEPFWRLDVGETGVTLATPEGTFSSEGPALRAPTPTVPGWRGLSARIGGEVLTVEIQPTVCQDSMSGQTYPDTVMVQFAGEALAGCGGDPMDLLVGRWRLAAVGAAPAAVGTQAATLEISEDGRISGFTGCNRMFGLLSVTGEGISISGVGVTRMACLNPSLASQEQRLTQGLAAATAFSIDAEGALLLSSGQAEALRWVRFAP